jgi:hypothetical protein
MILTIKKNFNGVDVLQLMFNPNNVTLEQIENECNFVGLDFDLMNSKLNRVDIERHQQLSHKLVGYHSLLSQGVSGNHIKGITNSTFRLGTANVGIQLYDKSLKEKLEIQGIVRVETQIKKPEYLNRSNIFTLSDILLADNSKLMELYNIPKKLYLRNLDNLRNSEHDHSELVDLFNNCVENDRHFLQSFLSRYAIENIGLNVLLNVLDCANITAKQKSNSKKYLRQNVSFSKNSFSMVDEILSYFTLVA